MNIHNLTNNELRELAQRYNIPLDTKRSKAWVLNQVLLAQQKEDAS